MGGRQQPEQVGAFVSRGNSGMEWKRGKFVSDGTGIMSDGQSVISDGTSIMGDARTVMRDGYRMSKEETYLPCIVVTRYQSSQVLEPSIGAARYRVLRYRDNEVSRQQGIGWRCTGQQGTRREVQSSEVSGQ